MYVGLPVSHEEMEELMFVNGFFSLLMDGSCELDELISDCLTDASKRLKYPRICIAYMR